MELEFVSKRIATLEQEIHKLKTLTHAPAKKKIISLKGLFNGMHVTEQDFYEAKKSLFKNL